MSLCGGVSLRGYEQDKARELNLAGWARNKEDGSDKVVAEGEEKHLKELIDLCRAGDEYARDDKIDVEWGKSPDKFDNFIIK